jgi:hypothetical protein
MVSFMPRWMRIAVLLFAAAALSLEISFAQEAEDLDQVKSWLEQGVNSAFLTQEQADIMLNALQWNAAKFTAHAVVADGPQLHGFAGPIDDAAFQGIVQQFTSGQITAEEANEQVLALGLLPEGASFSFSTATSPDGISPPQIRGFTLVKGVDAEGPESQQVKIIAIRREGVESD